MKRCRDEKLEEDLRAWRELCQGLLVEETQAGPRSTSGGSSCPSSKEERD